LRIGGAELGGAVGFRANGVDGGGVGAFGGAPDFGAVPLAGRLGPIGGEKKGERKE